MELANLKNNKNIIQYSNILLSWQKKINLISNKTIPDIWERHIKDSLQLQSFITKNNSNIIDLGTGAGFPGLILALCDDSKNHYTLIDSNTKKTTFLNFVKSKLNLSNVTVLNSRIEDLFYKIEADYLLSRALTNLEQLIEYSKAFLSSKGCSIFLKGKTLKQEINNIKNKNLLSLFSFEIFKNKINTEGNVVILKRKKYE